MCSWHQGLLQVTSVFVLCGLWVKTTWMHFQVLGSLGCVILASLLPDLSEPQLLICKVRRMCMCVCSVMSDSLQPHGLQPTRLLCPWDLPGMNTGVGNHSLLQSIFPTQGSNLGLPHCRQILYGLSHRGSPWKVRRITRPILMWKLCACELKKW